MNSVFCQKKSLERKHLPQRMITPPKSASTATFSPTTIKAIVFDLDNTLIDHAFAEAKAIQTVMNAYQHHDYLSAILQNEQEHFLRVYRQHNERLWHDLAFRRITPEDLIWQRFAATLSDFFPHNMAQEAEHLGRTMGEEYMRLYKDNWRLLDGADSLLSALQHDYKLGVITNGFREQQRGKLAKFGWEARFDAVILSDEVGVMKPHREIFQLAEKALGYTQKELVYVGDNYVSDIEGAKDAGWYAVWLHAQETRKPNNRADATVSTLHELRAMFRSSTA
jgi:YjjG family noncanonical pyrimidine nucleotidase